MNDKNVKAQSKPLPVWARALITFVIGAGLLSMISLVGAAVCVLYTMQHCQDPKFISAVAQDVARFPNPLPKGYSYVFGCDLTLVKIVCINYENGKQQFVFVQKTFTDLAVGPQLPAEGGLGSKASIGSEMKVETLQDKVLDKAYEMGINTFLVQAKFASLISRGSWLMQGTQIPYRLGKLQGNHGMGLIACIMDQKSGKEILFYAVQPDGKDFDMKICTNLLQDMEGF